jgi:hypothetical protein
MKSKSQNYQPKQGVIETDLEDELVLLDPETREMFSLNSSGRLIWNNLATCDVSGLASVLREHFKVDNEQASHDVIQLIAELHKANLIIER